MRVRSRKALLRSALVLASALLAAPALALHEESPPATRLTSGDTHSHPFGRQWGNWFAFASSQDLLNIGAMRAPGKQIYVFNMGYYDCFNGTTKTCPPGAPPGSCQATPCPPPGTPYLRQVTNGPGDPDNPSIGNEINLQPGQILRDHWLAFDALGTFNNNVGGAAARRQIFLKNITTNEIRQVTISSTGDSTRPTVNELAGVIAFESTATPLAGFPNPSGLKQVYLYQRGTGFLKRLSVGPPPGSVGGLGLAQNPVVNQNGTGVVFESTSDLFGDGHDTGVSQIFYVKFDKRDNTTELFQVTNGSLSSQNPYIGDGPTTTSPNVIVFDSYATDLPGAGGIAGRQVYEKTIDPGSGEPSDVVARLTLSSIFGDCIAPHIDPTGNRLSFVCLGDPLQNSTVGNRLFILDRPSAVLYQMTGTGDVQLNFGQGIGQWFLSLATTADLTGAGACGYQLYILDFAPGRWAAATSLGQVPPDVIGQGPNSVIGQRTFEFRPGTDPSGSEIVITTRDGVVTAPITGEGRIIMRIGAPDEFTKETSILVEKAKVEFPPMEVPGFGALCMVPDADGQGNLDCDGGRPQQDVTETRDHHINDVDSFCLTGCHEGDAACQEHFVPVPHLTECPICDPVSSTCDIGFHMGNVCDPWPEPSCPQLAACISGLCPDGTACIQPSPEQPQNPPWCQMPALCDDGRCPDNSTCTDPDLPCQQGLTCVEDSEPTCNGPLVTNQTGVFTAGGMRVTIPIKVSLSKNPGPDDVYCTDDDVPSVVENLPAVLRLTTGVATATITDADDIDGTTLTATETGTPTDCNFLRLGDLAGNRLMGTLQFLDVPNLPGVRDMIVSLRLEAKPGVVSSCSPTCTASTDCDDNNICNGVEACVSSHCTIGTPLICDDLNVCNGLETCDLVLGCQAGASPSCDDNNVCTDDSCDPVLGCTYAANSNPCDDNQLCTTPDTCAGGICLGTPVACTDNNACNGAELCEPTTGLCQPGTPPNCDDNNVCTGDGCDSASGCFHNFNSDPCDDASLCSENDTCASGACVGTPTPAAAACAAGNGTVCDGIEQCNPLTGFCDFGTPLDCNDNNTCTNDSCDDLIGCLNVPNADPCDDLSACTSGDLCTLGLCLGLPVVCENGDVCDGVATCDPSLGCQAGPSPDCNDNNTCTDDSCDGLLGCLNVPNISPCDDTNACTSGDTCALGLCLGSLVNCDNGLACDGAETCDIVGGCLPAAPLDCNDNNTCTDDSCDNLLGCLNVPNVGLCDDLNNCTTGDVCLAGSCVGLPTVCTDNDVCNGVESCNPADGSCTLGTGLSCGDNNDCTDDTCDAVLGCANTPNSNPCDDASVCTSGDVCTDGACVGTALPCNDNNACNGVETCHPVFGCQVGATPVCNDADSCTSDVCDPAVGCVNTGAPNLAVCRIIELINRITSMSDEELGGWRKRLLKKANTALRATQRFYAGNARLQESNKRRAERRLQKFVGIVQSGLIKGTIDPVSGDELIQLAAAAAQALSQAVP